MGFEPRGRCDRFIRNVIYVSVDGASFLKRGITREVYVGTVAV
jgi:hypothetical protein